MRQISITVCIAAGVVFATAGEAFARVIQHM
jgi:hypothetical protein